MVLRLIISTFAAFLNYPNQPTLKNLFYFLALFLCSFFAQSQNSGTDYWHHITPEIRLNTGKFEFRFRPSDEFILTNTQSDTKSTFDRIDLMAGFVYKKFKLFANSKFDSRGRSHLGPRVDFNTKALKQKLLVHAQYRYYLGLNEISNDQQYFVSILEWDTNKWLNPGLMGIDLQTFQGTTLLLHGPSVSFDVTKNLSFMFAFMKDLNTQSRYYSFSRINIKFKINRKI